MKTLDEVEPRISISGSNTPVGAYTISQSGSYYLTGNRLCSVIGIDIDANNVTLDLNGYNLIGTGAGSQCGIKLMNCSNVIVKNGTIHNFGRQGILEENTHGSARNHTVGDVRVVGNSRSGSSYQAITLLGSNHSVKDCIVADNLGGGIYTDDGATIINCRVYDNGNFGIHTSSGSIIRRNLCYGNNYTGIQCSSGSTVIENTCYENSNYGIYGGAGATIKNNTSYDNDSHGISSSAYCTIVNNSVYSNGFDGIHAGSGSTITANTVSTNEGDGIYVNSYGIITGNSSHYNSEQGIKANSDSLVSGNVLRGNNSSSGAASGGIYVYSDCLVKNNNLSGNLGANIYVSSSDNSIEGNLVTDCTSGAGHGIYFNSGGNFYTNNRASGNSINYGGTLPSGDGDGGGNAEF